MLSLSDSPYILTPEAEAQVEDHIKMIEERVLLLRQSGKMNAETLKKYYGAKRFEQVAESNAIEGSTLGVGETQVAILKGITITGHDPAFVRDAQSLDKALNRAAELASDRNRTTDLNQLMEIHSLILGDRPGGGMFRTERVRISGSDHTPPKTWKEVMAAMEEWEKWSLANADAPSPIRAAVLHAWLSHIHPFIDGNGRTARAISNLELIRGGYPPMIIRKKERDRYIDALSQSDAAGDILSFLELVLERTSGALDGLEQAASEKQAFNPVVEKLRKRHELQLEVWRRSVDLLSSRIELQLGEMLADPSVLIGKTDFGGIADVNDFQTLLASRSIGMSWAFRFSVRINGFGRFSFLSYIGHRSTRMKAIMHNEGGPSLYWSIYDDTYERKWRSVTDEAPYFREATISLEAGDNWSAITSEGNHVQCTTAELADSVAKSLVDSIGKAME